MSENTQPLKRRKICRNIIIVMWSLFLMMVIFVFLHFRWASSNAYGWYGALPELQELENPKSQYSSELYSEDGVLLGKYFRSNRTPVPYEEISQNVKNALLATEDVRYFSHSGIDLQGTFAIVWYLLKGDRRGSSTITQQLAKNLFRTRKQSYKGSMGDKKGFGTAIDKTKEWLVAVELERNYTKEEIMTMYLNTVDFGSNSFGIKVAAKTFFGKDQKDLEIEEAAVLVGLLKAPSQYSPILNPKDAVGRRNTVLEQLNKYDYIDDNTFKLLAEQPIKLDYEVENHTKGSATYFRAEASKVLQKWCDETGYDLYEDGLKVYTTINSKMQTYAEAAMEQHMKELQDKFFEHWKGKNPWVTEGKWHGSFVEIEDYPEVHIKRGETYRILKNKYGEDTASINRELNTPRKMQVFSWHGDIDTVMTPMDSLKYYKHFLHSGMVSMDPSNGEIKAWVGGINFKHFKYDHVIQGKRQPGSTFKPIIYATAIGETDGVYSPCYKIVDAPVTFQVSEDDEDKTWTPKNADGEFTGDTMTLRQAMARSVNSITASLMKSLGPRTPHEVVKYARRLGITSDLEAVPALCLGVFDVTIYEMVGAYSAFANQGIWTEPHFISRIEDRYGNVVKEFTPEKRTALNKETAYLMLHMLMGTTQERGGTGWGLRNYGLLTNNQVAAKTGTTQNQSDGWFMGVVPQLVSGVWVGGDDKSVHFRTLEYGQGAKMALPIWGLYMEKVYADSTLNIKKQSFPRPSFDLPVELDCENYHSRKSRTDSTGSRGGGKVLYQRPLAPTSDE